MEKTQTHEKRAFSFEIRAEKNEKYGAYITGMPIVYNSKTNMGYYDEIIQSGALDGANLRDVRFLVNHDTSMIPLARSRNNNENSTMQMIVDGSGMSIRVNLDVENNPTAAELYSAVERRDIDGMSFMFDIDGEEWSDMETDHPTRTITKIANVYEVSAATFPAYEDTEINVRAKATLDNARLALENARNNAPDGAENDDNLINLEHEKLKLLTM